MSASTRLRRVTMSKKTVHSNPMSKSDRFSGLCPPEILRTLTVSELQRQETIYELIKTEKQYVFDMQLVISMFLNPIRERQLLPKQKIGSLFSNLENLVPVNQEILKELERRQAAAPTIDKIGDIFVDKGSLFKLYAVYCSNQSTVPALLAQCMQEHEPFGAYLKECSAKPECRAMLLTDFLIQPLQRICKYPLLLRAIMKSTSEKHEDFALISSAVEKVESVVEQINDRTRQVNNVQKLQDLKAQLVLDDECKDFELVQYGRLFIRETLIKKSLGVTIGKSTDLRLILFNDVLLLCTEREKQEEGSRSPSRHSKSVNLPSAPSEYIVRRVIPLFVQGTPKVVRVEKLQNTALELAEVHEWPFRKHIFLMDSEAERDVWATDIKKNTDLYLQQHEKEKITAVSPKPAISAEELNTILRSGGEESAFPGIRMHGDDSGIFDTESEREASKREKKTSLKKEKKAKPSKEGRTSISSVFRSIGSAATSSTHNLKDLVRGTGDSSSSLPYSGSSGNVNALLKENGVHATETPTSAPSSQFNAFAPALVEELVTRIRDLEEEVAGLKRKLDEEKTAAEKREATLREEFTSLKDQMVYLYRLVSSDK